MYTFESKIRYSETDSEGRLTLGALLNYFQDSCTFQSEEMGVGVAYTRQEHCAWVLSAWQIVVEECPRFCDEVVIGTYPYDFKGFLGYRNFVLMEKSGRYFAKANSIWTLLDTDTKRPIHPTQKMLDSYPLGEKLEMEYAERKITIPEGGQTEEVLLVKKHHL
ncbi:MAG: acyl-[Lachnospiraceae bacterium]|nr:acyl-[acyl-carrier-protein] thioesterase [Lachnospiraceae bacterium]